MNDISQNDMHIVSRAEVDPGRRSVRAMSKGVIRTFQTTVQNNAASQQMLRGNAPVFTVDPPPLQHMASEWNRIAQSVEHTVRAESVGGGFSSVNHKLSRMYGHSQSRSARPEDASDRGNHASRIRRSWGRTVSAEMSTFATHRVRPLFRRQNTDPTVESDSLSEETEVSFDYQLMIDGEQSIQ